jgi:Zn-finger protein
MAFRLTDLNLYQVLCAETRKVILTKNGFIWDCCECTYVIAGGNMGFSARKRLSAVQCSRGKRVVYDWIVLYSRVQQSLA